VSPWSRQSKRSSPLSWPIIFSITRVPKPRCVGGVAAGPPDSIQRKLSCPSAVRDHEMSTRPSTGPQGERRARNVANRVIHLRTYRQIGRAGPQGVKQRSEGVATEWYLTTSRKGPSRLAVQDKSRYDFSIDMRCCCQPVQAPRRPQDTP